MTMKGAVDFLKEVFSQWGEDKAPRLAAALAYYTVFSIAPLLIIIIAIAGLAFGQQAVRGEIVGQIEGLVGRQAAEAIQTMIGSASKPATGIVATVIGLVTLLLGASGLFGQLQDALNTVWEVAPRPGLGIGAMIKKRLVSFAMVAVLGLLLLVSAVAGAAIAAAGRFFAGISPAPAVALQAINLVFAFVVATTLFAIIYKVLPDARTGWPDVFVGAAVTTLLFALGLALVGLYMAHSNVASAYGAAGSLVVVLVWIYYSAQILLLGAEFTQVYANRYGARIQPGPDAISLSEEARGQQGIPHTQARQGESSQDKKGQHERAAEALTAPPADANSIHRALIERQSRAFGRLALTGMLLIVASFVTGGRGRSGGP